MNPIRSKYPIVWSASIPKAASFSGKSEQIILLNPAIKQLPKEWQRFMVLHEEGHLELDTDNELACDAYAFKKYADEGHSLKEAINALEKVLEFEGNKEHNKRLHEQVIRCLLYDYYAYGNQEAINIINQITKPENKKTMSGKIRSIDGPPSFGGSDLEKEIFETQKGLIEKEKKKSSLKTVITIVAVVAVVAIGYFFLIRKK